MLEARKAKFGAAADHEAATLATMALVALRYQSRGRWDEAEELQVQVMEATKATLGAHHVDTRISVANLAWTVWKLGRLDEVTALLDRALEADEPFTLLSMELLGFAIQGETQLLRVLE